MVVADLLLARAGLSGQPEVSSRAADCIVKESTVNTTMTKGSFPADFCRQIC